MEQNYCIHIILTCLAFILSQAVSPAVQLKTDGNEAYKAGNLPLAIRLYTESLQYDPEDHTVYSNRSMAYCKTKMYEEALKDAEMCTWLKPDWVKVCIN